MTSEPPPPLVLTPPPDGKTPWGQVRRLAFIDFRLQFEGQVNRKDFGLNWNKALEAGGVLIGESVQITIDLQLVRKDAAK